MDVQYGRRSKCSDRGTEQSRRRIVDQINWSILSNACRKRLKNHFRRADIDDATQEAIAFAWREVAEHDTPIGLAVVRACSRVKRGQRVTWQPQGRKERWELEISATRAYRAPL